MTKKQLGQLIKDTRRKKGLTHYALAKAAGLRIQQVQAIEEGSKAYTVDSLMKVLKAIGMEILVTPAGGQKIMVAFRKPIKAYLK